MKQATTLDYSRRLENVIRHMGSHLDGELDLAALAEIACLSPYHFHRVYAGMTGETAAETLRRLRLHRAASDLLDGTMPIPRVGDTGRLWQRRRLHAGVSIQLRHRAGSLSQARFPGC